MDLVTLLSPPPTPPHPHTQPILFICSLPDPEVYESEILVSQPLSFIGLI